MKSFTEKRSGIGQTNQRNLCEGNGNKSRKETALGRVVSINDLRGGTGLLIVDDS